MSWTKEQFVLKAYAEIGFSNRIYDLKPEHLEYGLTSMDAMIATWNELGIRLGYLIPDSYENSNLNDETNVPDRANQAIYTNLAIRIADTLGKVVSENLKLIADSSYAVVLGRAALPNPRRMPNDMPRGAGNKGWRQNRPFISSPPDKIDVGSGGDDLELEI